jgi:hypothetical protein
MNPYDPVLMDPTMRRRSCTSTREMTPFSFCNISANLECERQARRKLREWGFDPDDVSKASSNWYASHLRPSSNINYGERISRPMIIFAHQGDLPMMRYILKKSKDPAAELSKTDEHGLFPLYVAISKPHSEQQVLAVCRWLYANGCDIQQTVGDGECAWSALSRACLFGFQEVAKWLLSSGSLLENTRGSFDTNLAKRDLPSYGYIDVSGEPQVLANQIRRNIFVWSNEIVSTRNNFLLFLWGTLQPNEKTISHPRPRLENMLVSRGYFSKEAVSFLLQEIPDAKLGTFLEMAKPPLRVFNGHPGILEQIGQYLGVQSDAKLLRTVRGLVEHEK